MAPPWPAAPSGRIARSPCLIPSAVPIQDYGLPLLLLSSTASRVYELFVQMDYLGPLRELAAPCAWLIGTFKRHVSWRGQRLLLSSGTLLYAERSTER